MLLPWAWIVLSIAVCVATETSLEHTQNIKAFIDLTELDYEDVCHKTAEAEWNFIISPSNESLLIWEENQIAYGNFTKTQRQEVTNHVSWDKLSDPFLKYKYSVIEKAGDALLEDDDWEKLVVFYGDALSLQSSTVYEGKTKKFHREDVNHLLGRDGSADAKREAWMGWYQELNPLVGNFSENLQLIQKAATANGVKDVREYWETLSGYPDGYGQMLSLWNEISHLHKKLMTFVQSHVSVVYNLTSTNNTMPPYLLGSLEGYDWTEIPIDMMPYEDEIHSIKKNLWHQKYVGQSLYKSASTMGKRILLSAVPEAQFWEHSRFNGTCPSRLINFCQDGVTRVSTCFDATISNFLSAHKNVAKVLFNQMTDETSPILNIANRYSGLEEGMSELFGILAASPAWLDRTHLMLNSSDQEKRQIVSLMITALDVLPRLAYYVSADMWRINAIENEISNPEDQVTSWWKYRQEYEGITTDNSSIPSFLSDHRILRNQPYLPKFIGTFLGFQLYDFLMGSTEVRFDRLEEKTMVLQIIKMIQQGGADDWFKTVEKFLEIDEISSNALLSFFSPLEDFIEEMQEEFTYTHQASRGKELEDTKNKIIKEINNPTTTAAPTTTTTKKPIRVPQSPSRKHAETENTSSKDDKSSLESDSSIRISDNVQERRDTPSESKHTIKDYLENLKSIETKPEAKPKTNKSKAAWAVGVVLIATITICIIAIFGQKRCRRTPKNRRYV